MELYLLRHGESIKGAGLSLGTTSRNSGLTENGKKEITRIAKSIKRFNVKFDAILTSPLNSAMQTAKIISSTFKLKDGLINCDELVPEGNMLKLYNRLQHFTSESSILIVGHEPYLTNIIDDMIPQQRSKDGIRRSVTNKTKVKGIARPERSIVVKRGGLAKIRIISTTPELRGELRWLLTPRILKSLSEESYTVEKTRQKK
jgi:phosphohistidine phosphatase